MLKTLAILGMVLVVFGSHGCAEQVQGKDQHQQPTAPVAPITQQQHDSASLHGEQSQDVHAKVEIVNPPQKDFYDKALVWIDLALVFIALGTGIVIGWQSFETRNATRGAKLAADAALLNAQAFINAERPWILVREEQSKRRKTTHEVFAVNKGRTPAVIISHSENGILIDGVGFPPDVPTYKDSDDRTQIVLPDESVQICEFSERSLVGKDEATRTRFRNLDLEGYVFGVITYRDLIGPPTSESHETCWCFHVLPWGEGDTFASEYRWGGDAYSRHT